MMMQTTGLYCHKMSKYNFYLINRKFLKVFGNYDCSAIWQLPYFNFIEILVCKNQGQIKQ